MVITKELYREKNSAPSGLLPVVVRVKHLDKETVVRTSVMCHTSHWDKTTGNVTNADCQHRIKNESIDSVFRRVAGNIQRYLDNFLRNNFETILDSVPKEKEGINDVAERHPLSQDSDAPTCFAELIRKKSESTHALNTRRGYESFLRYFKSRFGNGPSPGNISRAFINDFIRVIENDFPAKGVMRRLNINRLNAVINFGKETGVVARSTSVKLPSYPLMPADRNLSINQLREIHKTFSRHMECDPEMKKDSTMSLALFMLDIAFQGLAPVDLASLKVGDITMNSIQAPNSLRASPGPGNPADSVIDVVSIKTFRKKTGMPVGIVAELPPIRKILAPLMKGKESDDFLIPCFDKNSDYTPEQRQNRLANFFRKMKVNLNRVLCRETSTSSGSVTFYYARHAFCNLIDSLDVPRHIIQLMIGHRTSILEKNYLRPLSPGEQARLSSLLFRLLSDCDAGPSPAITS